MRLAAHDRPRFETDLQIAVARAREAAGDRSVDVLGAGVRMFSHPGGPLVGLEPLAGESAHRYRVVR